MVLAAPAVAHDALPLVTRLATVAAAALWLSAAIAGGAEPPPFESYRAALDRGDTGIVDGRAYIERRKPDEPDLPLKDVALTLVPYSDMLLVELEGVKGHARDSLDTYRAAALRVRRLQEAYEKTVWEAGAADLVHSSLIGPNGRFSFADVAAGQWVLWARHEVLRSVAARKPKKGDKESFALGPKLIGYRTASFWVIPVTVSGGAASTIELTDRNIWFTGVIEETMRQDIAP